MAMDTVETVRARPERADGRARGGNAGRGGGLVDAGTARGAHNLEEEEHAVCVRFVDGACGGLRGGGGGGMDGRVYVGRRGGSR